MQRGGKKLDNMHTLGFTNFHVFLFSGISVQYFTNARKNTQNFQFFLYTCKGFIQEKFHYTSETNQIKIFE